MRKPRTAIVLVNWNGWQDSVECLDSVLGLEGSDFHIVLVDNDSRDGSMGHISAWCASPYSRPEWARPQGVRRWTDPDVGAAAPVGFRVVDDDLAPAAPPDASCRLTIVRSRSNRGFAGGNNIGIRVIDADRFDYVWLLNTDTVVHAAALRCLIDRAELDPTVGMVGSSLIYYGAPDHVQAFGGAKVEGRHLLYSHVGIGMPVSSIPSTPAAVKAVEDQLVYIVGASMLVRTRLIAEVGLMQEDYFLYFEEVDWAMRARGHYRLGYAPDSRVHHKVGASSAQVMSEFSFRLLHGNKLRFVQRFLPAHIGAVRAYMWLDVAKLIARQRFKEARWLIGVLWGAPKVAPPVRRPAVES